MALAKAGAQVLVHYGSGAKEAETVVAEIRKGGGRADTVGVDLSAADGPHSPNADHWSGHAIGRSIRRRLTPSREAVDCRLDEGGGQESERDGSADPTFGFAFARGEQFDRLVGTGGQFVEPVMSAAKRVGEDRAPLQKPP